MFEEENEKKSTWECLVDIISMLGNSHEKVSEMLKISMDELDQLVQRKMEFSAELKPKVLRLFIKLEEHPELWVGDPIDAMDAAERFNSLNDLVFVEGDRRSTAASFPIG